MTPEQLAAAMTASVHPSLRFKGWPKKAADTVFGRGEPHPHQAAIVEAYRRGDSVKDIATTYKVGMSRVVNAAKAAGVPMRVERQPIKRHVETVAHLQSQGLSRVQIAARVGISRRQVSRVLEASAS